MTIEGNRLLRKLCDSAAFGNADPSNDFIKIKGDGWSVYTNDVGFQFGVWRSYFDLAGWAREDLSAFIGGVGWQECDGFFDPLASVGPLPVSTWDLVTKAFIPNSALDSTHFLVPADGIGWAAPGMQDSNYDLEEVFAGRYRQFGVNTTTSGTTVQVNNQLWGTGDATGGDKIYLTRIVALTGTQVYNGQLYVPPQAIIVPATIVEEDANVYHERMRRSYVLAESR